MLPVLIATILMPCALAQPEVGHPAAVLLEREFHFGRVARGSVVRHEFVVENRGSAPLVIARIGLTAPLVADRIPRVEPGQRASIPIRLDSSSLQGPFQGEVVFFTNDPAHPEAHASFVGEVFQTIELAPLPAFFIATSRGVPKEQSIDIINHEPNPLRILGVEHPGERFETRLETIEDGRRYRLTLRMPGTGAGGKHTDRIAVRTSSPSQPTIQVPANTWLRERVHTFPDQVDLGSMPFQKIKDRPDLLDGLTQTLMVYQVGGKAFDVKAHSDLKMLEVVAERGPQGDRWELKIRIGKNIQPGLLRGSILIETNDEEFRILRVPVRGLLF